jgi:hypothetical protein
MVSPSPHAYPRQIGRRLTLFHPPPICRTPLKTPVTTGDLSLPASTTVSIALHPSPSSRRIGETLVVYPCPVHSSPSPRARAAGPTLSPVGAVPHRGPARTTVLGLGPFSSILCTREFSIFPNCFKYQKFLQASKLIEIHRKVQKFQTKFCRNPIE